MSNLCRSCKAPIRWVRMPSGKPNPLNPEPHYGGNVRILEDGTGQVLTRAALAEARAAGEPLYLSHFADCPNRAQHRNPQPAR